MDNDNTDTAAAPADPGPQEGQAAVDPRLQAAMEAEQGPLLRVLNEYLQDRVARLRAEVDRLALEVEARDAYAGELHDQLQQLRDERAEADART